jgi:TRAP-type C4-dicarboxylate transport system permease small subunit
MDTKGVQNCLTRVQKGAEYFAAFLLLAMVAIVFANVFCRFVLNASIAWSEEVARFLFLWIVFLGSFFAFVTNEHLGLDLIVNAVSERTAKWMNVARDLLVIFSIGVVTVGGYSITKDNWDWLSPAISIPYGYVNIIVPLTMAPMLIIAIIRFFRHIRNLF